MNESGDAEEDRTWQFQGLYQSNLFRMGERMNDTVSERLTHILNIKRLGFGFIISGGVSFPFSRILAGMLGTAGVGLILCGVIQKHALQHRINRLESKHSARFQRKHGLTGHDMWKIKSGIDRTA
ncbi:MAG: hypothetical protein V4437_02855 [Patescibacteria group bacterium]